MGKRLDIIDSNFGRDHGWYAELNDQRLAALTDPQRGDEFWYSYRVESLTNDAELKRNGPGVDARALPDRARVSVGRAGALVEAALLQAPTLAAGLRIRPT
jgi:hypothetical protein